MSQLHELHGHQIDPNEVAAFHWCDCGEDGVLLYCAIRACESIHIHEAKPDDSETAEQCGARLCADARKWQEQHA